MLNSSLFYMFENLDALGTLWLGSQVAVRELLHSRGVDYDILSDMNLSGVHILHGLKSDGDVLYSDGVPIATFYRGLSFPCYRFAHEHGGFYYFPDPFREDLFAQVPFGFTDDPYERF